MGGDTVMSTNINRDKEALLAAQEEAALKVASRAAEQRSKIAESEGRMFDAVEHYKRHMAFDNMYSNKGAS
jgi:hypothetical protein